MRSPHTEHASSRLPKPTPLEGGGGGYYVSNLKTSRLPHTRNTALVRHCVQGSNVRTEQHKEPATVKEVSFMSFLLLTATSVDGCCMLSK